MNKEEQIQYWKKRFNDNNIDFQEFNGGYHLKVGNVNFYPTTNKFYNSDTGKSGYIVSMEDVLKVLETDKITPEEVFNEMAKNMMVTWNYEEFKETHSHLHSVIIESMKAWCKI